jgi:hypothetical protein
MRRPAWMTSAWWKAIRRPSWTRAAWLSSRIEPLWKRLSAWAESAWMWVGSRRGTAWLTRAWWAPKIRAAAGSAWKWLASWMHPPEDLDGRDETKRWATSYAALRDADDSTYSLAREYAKERYDELVTVSQSLNTKLDELARTALTIGAIVATLVRVLGLDTALSRSPLAALAIVFSVLTVLTSALTRRPNKSWKPMNARTFLEAADLVPNLPKSRIEGVTAASYHFAVIGMTAAVEWKAGQLRRATWLFCISLVLIALMVIFPLPSPSYPMSAATSAQ